jgi:hypothetical protein
MAIRTGDDSMSLEIGVRVVATARFSPRCESSAPPCTTSGQMEPGCCIMPQSVPTVTHGLTTAR